MKVRVNVGEGLFASIKRTNFQKLPWMDTADFGYWRVVWLTVLAFHYVIKFNLSVIEHAMSYATCETHYSLVAAQSQPLDT